jgi:importin-9
MREKLLKLLYLAIESFSYADGVDKKIIHACFDQTYQEWMSIFVSALQTTVRSHLNIKRYILKILTRIFSDLVHYTSKSLTLIIQPVWKFLNANLPLFIWSTVYGVPVEQIEDGMKEPPKEILQKNVAAQSEPGFEFLEDGDMIDYVEGLTLQLIELMITLTERRQLEPILRLGIFPLTNSLAYYMLFSKEQEKNWFDDPNQFVADDEDEGNMLSVRNGALKIIDNLIEAYGDEATQALMVISEKFLTNMKEEEVYGFLKGVFEKVNLKGSKASVLQDFDTDKLIALVKSSHFEGDHPDHVWKKREVGLLLLGKYSEDIVTFMSNKSQGYDLSKFLEQLIKGLDENSKIVYIA